MPKQTAPIVAKVLWENFLVNYGWPEDILTDQGKNFESSLVTELCELAGVQKLRIPPTIWKQMDNVNVLIKC